METFSSLPRDAEDAAPSQTAVEHAPARTHAPRHHNAPAATEIPGRVQLIGVLGYAGILGAMWLAFSGHGDALFMISVSTFFAVVFFSIPFLMFRTARRHGALSGESSMHDFLAGRLDTWTGQIGGWEALVQVVAVPVCLAFGSVVIAIIVMSARVAG